MPSRNRFLWLAGGAAALVAAAGAGRYAEITHEKNELERKAAAMTGGDVHRGQALPSVASGKPYRFADDAGPLDPACSCYTCATFSRAYLRHLFLMGEMTAAVLHTIHNLHYYLDTMSRIRQAIVFGSVENVRRSLQATFSRPSCDS